MFRGLYYGSYSIYGSRYLLWAVGVIIFFLMIYYCLFSYVLPWGQMIILGRDCYLQLGVNNTGIGEKLVTLLWGGYFVSQAALKSLFCFHSLFSTLYINCIMFFYIYYYYMKYHSSIPLRLNFTVESD